MSAVGNSQVLLSPAGSQELLNCKYCLASGTPGEMKVLGTQGPEVQVTGNDRKHGRHRGFRSPPVTEE